jgi:hypothetical protein
MPKDEQNPRSFLEERRSRTLAELRRKVPELIKEYLRLTAAIDAMDSADETKESAYAEIYKPLDAVDAYLESTGKPAPRETIARALADGGWGAGRKSRPYWNLLSMMKYHLGTGDKSLKSEPRLKEINKLVGKVEWPDEMFRVNGSSPETQKEGPHSSASDNEERNQPASP